MLTACERVRIRIFSLGSLLRSGLSTLHACQNRVGSRFARVPAIVLLLVHVSQIRIGLSVGLCLLAGSLLVVGARSLRCSVRHGDDGGLPRNGKKIGWRCLVCLSVAVGLENFGGTGRIPLIDKD